MSTRYSKRRVARAVRYLKRNKYRLLRMAALRGVTTGIAVFVAPYVFGPVSAMIWGSQHIPPGAKEYVVTLVQKTLEVS